MQRLYVGIATIEFTAPHRLNKPARRALALKVCSKLLEDFSSRITQDRRIHIDFELIYAKSGCIRAKFRIFLRMAAGTLIGTAVAIFASIPDAKVQQFWEDAIPKEPVVCISDDKTTACKILSARIHIAGTFYTTKRGDRLLDIAKQVMQIEESKLPEVVKLLRTCYQDFIVDQETDEMRPGIEMPILSPALCNWN